MKRLNDAIAWAAHYHRAQIDRRGEPYILHPIRIMTEVRRSGFGEKFQIAALLHDVLEDCHGPTPLEIKELFGAEVLYAVEALTRRFKEADISMPVVDSLGARVWGEPLETHWDYFQRCIQDPIGRVVKYFDTLDNADPHRHTAGVPVGRYIKVLDWYAENGVPKP